MQISIPAKAYIFIYIYIYIYIYPPERAKNTKICQQWNTFNKYSTIKHKYDVSLSLQLIHVCALKTTEMIKNIIYVQIRY